MARNTRTDGEVSSDAADFDAMSAVDSGFGSESAEVTTADMMRANFEVPIDEISDTLFDVLEPGIYAGVVKKTSIGRTKKGDKTLAKIEIRVTGNHGFDTDPVVFQNITLVDEDNKPDEKGFTRLKIIFRRVAPEALGKSLNPMRDLPLLVDRECAVRIEKQEYEGRETNNVREIYGPQAAEESADDDPFVMTTAR